MRSYKDFKCCERRGELCIGADAGKLPGGSLKKFEGHARFMLLVPFTLEDRFQDPQVITWSYYCYVCMYMFVFMFLYRYAYD